ncbi:glycosyltransferase family 4 protein [Methylobacterium sp. C25]|nr:glycosyltransferase family 4 protein [Methylobacterium sp. C25]
MDDPTQSPKAAAGPAKTVAFVSSDDAVFAADGLPMARAAIAMGLSVAVITRIGSHREAIEATGARLVALDDGRSGLNPMSAGYAAGQLSAILKALKADIVHCVGLRGILVGGTAAAMAGIQSRVYAPGALARDSGRLSRLAVKGLLRGPLANRSTRYLLESADDARALGLDPADTAVTILDRTGSDPSPVAGIYAELLSA